MPRNSEYKQVQISSSTSFPHISSSLLAVKNSDAQISSTFFPWGKIVEDKKLCMKKEKKGRVHKSDEQKSDTIRSNSEDKKHVVDHIDTNEKTFADENVYESSKIYRENSSSARNSGRSKYTPKKRKRSSEADILTVASDFSYVSFQPKSDSESCEHTDKDNFSGSKPSGPRNSHVTDEKYKSSHLSSSITTTDYDQEKSYDRNKLHFYSSKGSSSSKRNQMSRSFNVHVRRYSSDSDSDYEEQKVSLKFHNNSMSRKSSSASSHSWNSRDEDCATRQPLLNPRSGISTNCSPQNLQISNVTHKHNRRYSEGFYANRSVNNFQSSSDRYDSYFHKRQSASSFERQSLFDKEFKSAFYGKFDADQMERARSVLCTEVESNVPFVDTHCHIDFLFKRLRFAGNFSEYADETFFKFPKNFEGCITDWCQPSLYHQAGTVLNLKDQNFKIWGAFGCHPHFVEHYTTAVEKQIEFHIDQYPNVIAWGEMGLDYSDRFGPTDHDLQKQVFKQQLKLACKRQYPLVIHCRDADRDLIQVMKKYVPHDTKIHRHCLTTEVKDVRPLLEYFPNCHVGFTNLITNRSASRARQAVESIPIDRIVLETDAPYFIPRTITRESRGNAKWSHPGMASCVANEIADLKNTSVNDVLLRIRENVTRLYGI